MLVRSIALGVAAVALLSSAANAADLIIPTTPAPIMESAGFSWEGLYAGVRAGGAWIGDANTYGNIVAPAGTAGAGVIGGAVGVNFVPASPFLVGLEGTADYVWYNGTSSGEFFANLRAGAVVTDSVLVYAIGGVGVQTNNNVSTGLYQLGGGVELAVTDAITVRGELVGQGDFNNGGANDPFFEAAKATVGVFYHF